MSTQSNWWWCNKCQVLTFGGNLTAGVCQAGGLHDHSGSGQYSLVHDDSAVQGQSNWRWCNKCTALAFAGNASVGSCAAGGAHDHAGSGNYSLVQNDPSAPGQSNWQWCKNCEVLAFAGSASLGPCPAGGMHDHTGSGNYSLVGTNGLREPIDQTISRHLLTEFGPCDTPAAAAKTLNAACAQLTAKGGGIVVIPDSVPRDFYPRNAIQDAASPAKPGVLIEDYRGGGMRLVVRPEPVDDFTGVMGGGVLIERDIVNDIHGQGGSSALGVSDRSRGGVSSVHDFLQQDVLPGNGLLRDVRCYVTSLRGLCPGNWMNLQNAKGEVASGPVKALGMDGDKPYFVVETTYDFQKGNPYWNKNWFSAFELHDTHNSDDQSGTISLTRQTYGTGDSFGIHTIYKYSGEIMSAGGDEGGIVYACDVLHDTDLFNGHVDTWDPATATLVYTSDSKNTEKIGTSRPIINLQPAKSIRTGKIIIPVQATYKGLPGKCILGNADVTWDASILGKWITIDEPSEYYDPANSHDVRRVSMSGPLTQIVRRWYRIGSVTKRPDGVWRLGIEGVSWLNFTDSYPTRLLDGNNYTWSDNAPKELRYIIAPGSWAVDVSEAVSLNRQPSARTIRLAPFQRAQDAFAPGDPIVQPPGANTWKPISFRTRVSNLFPDTSPVGCVEIQNYGATANTGIWIRGHEYEQFDDKTPYVAKDGRPAYGSALAVTGTTEYAIDLGGPMKYAGIYITGPVDQYNPAIALVQRDGNAKPIAWQNPGGESRIDSDPAKNDLRVSTNNFVVNASGHIDLSTRSTVQQGGLSGTATASNNLRALDVAVPAGASSKVVTFAKPEPDAHYAVLAESDWVTAKSVHAKTATGFTVQFSANVPPAGGKLDWLLVR